MRVPLPRLPQVKASYYPLAGGMDLVTPRISVKPGVVLDAQNYEPNVIGGYRRINGYERYDGRPSPTAAVYAILGASLTGSVTVGATITGALSGATARVLGVFYGNTIVVSRVTGTFAVGESLTIAGAPVATATTTAIASSATTSSDHADYRLLAANDLRADIGVVPGEGPILGVFVLNDVVYASRDNVGKTANLLYKATPGGWTQISLGTEILVGARTFNATNAATTWTAAAHGMTNGQSGTLSTTGVLPTGFTAGTTYFIVAAASGSFGLSATAGGSAISGSGGSGVHTFTHNSASGIAAGQTITGVTSGATAVASVVLLRAGTWTVGPVGSLVLTSVVGTFVNGEALQVAGVTQAGSTSASAAIVRAPGGRLEVAMGNFNSSVSGQKKAYGADGVNPAFEFDGTLYVPIHTGMTLDTPSHVAVHKNKLFLSFLGSLQYSATTNPYAWSVVVGANEISLPDPITAMVTQTGNFQGPSLSIFTQHNTAILYGSSSADFNLVSSVYDLGCKPYTVVPVSNSTYGLTRRGVQSLITTLSYGDFSFAALSILIQPQLDAKYALASAATTLRASNQYRLFFSDGTGYAFGLSGEKLSGILPLNYGRAVRCIWSSTLTSGAEVTYFGSDDGYLYQDNVGTSFDGGAIEAWCRPVFNNLSSPLLRKRFRRAILESSCEGFAQIQMAYDLGYGNPDIAPSPTNLTQNLAGGGGYWDQFSWDGSFTWDAALVQEVSLSIDGAENNVGFVFYSNRAQDDPHILQGIQLLWSPRHTVRS